MNRRSRSACLTGALLTVLLTVLLTAGPALADSPLEQGEGVQPRDGISLLEALALYVVIPGAILFVIGGLAWITGGAGGPRYRPARGWDAAPVWFAGPPDPAGAVASADAGTVVRGGASGSW